MGTKGTVASTAALSVLLQEGIGDTIRVSLTPQPGEPRTQEVVVALEILQALGLRAFNPSVTACPGCGRTTSTTFQDLAKQIDDFLRTQMPVWKARYPGVENMSALKRQGLGPVWKAIADAWGSATRKLPTPVLTRLLHDAVEFQQPKRSGAFRPKLRYAHQGGRNPPVIVIHGNSLEHITDAYKRFLEGRFREHFKLTGTPLRIEMKVSRNPFVEKDS